MMLALDQELSPGVFADHADPAIRHIVPDRLQLATAAGAPDFELMLFRALTNSGGQLSARFQSVHSEHGFPSAPLIRRQRIALRSMADDLDVLLDWQTVFADADDAVLFRHALSADQAALATTLAREGSELFEITVEEERAAMRGPQPWRVSGDADAMHDALAALVSDTPVSATEVSVAVQSLPQDMITWVPLGGDQSEPDAHATAALVSRMLGRFFVGTSDGLFLLGRRETGPLDLRLDREWAEILCTRLTWGFDQAPELIADGGFTRHFPMVDQTSPFVNAEINLINQVPLDPLSAQKLHVDLAYTGHQGTETTESFDFAPGDDRLQSHNIVMSGLGPAFRMRSRARVLLPPSDLQGFPLLWPKDAAFVDRGGVLTVAITPEDLDVQLRRIEVDRPVFDLANRITIRLRSDLYTAVISLDEDQDEAWVVLPGATADYVLTVEAENGAAVHPISPAIADDPVVVLAQDLVPETPVDLTVTLAPDIVLAIVEWQDQEGKQPLRRHVVTPDETPVIQFWPSSVFASHTIRWRASVVRRGPDGTTAPLAEGDWSDTAQPHFDIL